MGFIELAISFFKTRLGRYVALGIGISIIVLYLLAKIWILNGIIDRQDSKITVLENNIKKVTEVNRNNVTVMNRYKKDIEVYKKSYDAIVEGKDKEISHLKKIIKDLKRPVHYPKEVIYKDCIIKIKEKDENEDSILNSLNTIGF